MRREGSSETRPFRANLVVDRCYALLAALMAAPLGAKHHLYLAVGVGGDSTAPVPTDERLHHEIYRQALSPSAIRFLDGSGAPSPAPTRLIELRALLDGELVREAVGSDPTLQEFGLFGGNATDELNSGFLINRVVHDPILLGPAASIERTIELSFGAGFPGGDASDSGAGALGEGATEALANHPSGPPSVSGLLSALTLQGIGEATRTAYSRAGIVTIASLSALDPGAPVLGVNETLHRELVSKARLVAGLGLPSTLTALAAMPLSEIVTTSTRVLVERTAGALTARTAQALQHAVSVLEWSLDQPVFEALRVGDLLAPPQPWSSSSAGPFGADLPIEALRGAAETVGSQLTAAGIRNVGELAELETAEAGQVGGVAVALVRELISKAKILRRIQLPRSAMSIGGLSASQVLRTPPGSLASERLPLRDVISIQHALGLLALVVDHHVLEGVRLSALVAPA